jgi:hypothetical protein
MTMKEMSMRQNLDAALAAFVLICGLSVTSAASDHDLPQYDIVNFWELSRIRSD